MFYAPKTVASMVAPALECLYSDLHKDAIGCRPGADQSRAYDAMSPVERGVEHARLAEWMAEGERIEAMRVEVARFTFSHSIEYRRRREGMSELAALESTIVDRCNGDRNPDCRYTMAELEVDMDYAVFLLGLPYEDAPKISARLAELRSMEGR